MLNSLEIRNYRNLRHLTIEKLGRVNLLVGKNNTGKTSVLEAVYLWVNNGRFDVIYEVLEGRGGTTESTAEERYSHNKSTIASMFSDRKMAPVKDYTIYIEANDDGILSSLSLGFQGGYSGSTEHLQLLAFSIKHTNLDRALLIPLHQTIDPKDLDYLPQDWPISTKNQFIISSEINRVLAGKLYDEIATTDWEEEVINALKIIDRSIIKFAFRADSVSGKRYPVVRLEGSTSPVPLRSMGDGINRILTIILAMVNCENGYLFIDEFENGLHYSVQEKLWEIIFYLAERLNIQVFATTHSNDTIKAFGEVANSKPDYKDAQLIQLRNVKGDISAVLFNTDDVEIATETDYLDLR